MMRKTEIYKYYLHCTANVQKNYLDIVENYIKYYHFRAVKCKRMYYFINIIKIAILGAVPVLHLAPKVSDAAWIIAIVSAAGLAMETILGLFRYKDKWQLYRDTNNTLMSEQRKYYCNVDNYKNQGNDKAWNKFVVNIENIVGEEARKWSDGMKEKRVVEQK